MIITIHGVFQYQKDKQKDSHWLDIDNHGFNFNHIDRILFERLCGVANQFDIVPIAPCRGLPTDIGNQWLGRHSHSWLTSEEILNAEPMASFRFNRIVCRLAANRPSHERRFLFNGSWSPEKSEYPVVISDPWDHTAETTHFRYDMMVDPNKEISYFMKLIQGLHDQYGGIRFVFGFTTKEY